MLVFDTYEFTFAGHSSREYDMVVCDVGDRGQDEVAFGNAASIVSSRTTRRVQPIHHGVNYHEEPLEFSLVFACEHELDRFELEAVSFWLTGHQQYQWLTIDQPDMAHVQFRCLITNLTPIFSGWLPVAFEATVTCDCPYAYGYPFSEVYSVSGTQRVLFRNNGSVHEYIKPKLDISMSNGGTELKIINHSDNGREFSLSGLPGSGLHITVDNNSGVITEEVSHLNIYPYFNMKFFRLVHGDNDLEISGNGTVTMTGRTLHNVAG